MSGVSLRTTAAEQLRAIVRAMANEPETFLDAYTLPQLVALYTASARASCVCARWEYEYFHSPLIKRIMTTL